ncbi:MAG TPA: RagB/SusD family nutrient uptake outer membrane protein [Puia sp.]
MKSKIYISGAVLGSLLMAACTKLDREFVTTLSQQQVTQNFTYTSNRAAAVYTHLPLGFLYIDGAMMASATDEAEHTPDTSTIQNFNSGNWNATANPDDVWAKYYQGIRDANLFLESAGNVNLDQWKLNPALQATYQTNLDLIKKWEYEVRFLRAYFYFELVKRYGGVPLLTSSLAISDTGKTRASLADCIKFMTDECDSAALNLPATPANTDLGRATKGAALALKSRVLLYAASDLFNTPSGSSPALVSIVGGDRMAQWKAAADAAKAVIDLGTYTLSPDYSTLFSSTNYRNNEVIFATRSGPANTFEIASYPIGFDLGQSGTTPTQNMVDAYEMTDGTPFDWNNPTESADPYSNRDPRLGMSVITNNSMFKSRPVEIWAGGRDGKGVTNATKTGYYLRKYVNPDLDLLLNTTSVHTWILIRLGEIYLNYAEALNEYDPGNPDIKLYVDAVRARPGVNMPGLPGGLSQDQMRDRIRNERRVELAFEDHRFWDVRRWMIGPITEGAPITGVDIQQTAPSSFTYTKVHIEDRYFDPKMYLYPIPQGEVANGLIQNPLW